MAAPQVPKHTDVENWVNTTNQIGSDLGDVSAIVEGYPDIVTGVNDIVTEIGLLGSLDDLDQTSIVAAINDLKRTMFIMGIVFTETLN